MMGDPSRQERIAELFRGINPEDDTFLGETCIQISGQDGYPSVHTVRSYLIRFDPYTTYFYHVFYWKCGTTVVNYRPWHYEEVARFIDVSDYWDIYYVDDEDKDPLPVDLEWRHK